MNADPIAIIGSGTIGTAWAIVFATAGHKVTVHDINASRIAQAEKELRSRIDDLRKFELVSEAPEAITERVSFTDKLAMAVTNAIHVQECIPEDIALKRQLFAELDAITDDATTIASSSSFLPISATAKELSGRHQFLVVHPGNPPFLLRIAEICPAPFTNSTIVERIELLLQSCGLQCVRVQMETEGFIFNRLQGALLREAYRLVSEGVATADDIDLIVRDGLGLRWSVVGPFETSDLNTSGGIEAHAARMLPVYAHMGAAHGERQGWTDETIEKVTAARRATLPLSEWQTRAAWRDQELMALLRHRQQRR